MSIPLFSMASDRFLEAYGSMGILSGLVQVVYLGTAFWLGTRLVLRARRSRELPELLLGLHLLLALGLGYVLVSAGVVVAELSDDPPRHVIAPLLALGYAITIAGLTATLLFTRQVFHPDGRLGWALALGAAAAMGSGWLAYGASGGFSQGTFESLEARLLMGSMVLANGWVAVEPLRYYRRMRRRVRLGLAEPIVTDRFLLWGLGSLARVLMVLLGPISEHALRNSTGDWHAAIPGVTLAAASILGLGTSLCFWNTFEPSAPYRRWVAARYAPLLASAAAAKSKSSPIS